MADVRRSSVRRRRPGELHALLRRLRRPDWLHGHRIRSPGCDALSAQPLSGDRGGDGAVRTRRVRRRARRCICRAEAGQGRLPQRRQLPWPGNGRRASGLDRGLPRFQPVSARQSSAVPLVVVRTHDRPLHGRGAIDESDGCAIRGGVMTMDRLRRPIAVVVSRFPLITETFILRELIELEQRGQPVVLVPLIRERATIAHREARGWIERAHYTPYLSWPIVRANLRALAERPLRYVGLLGRLIAGSLGSPSMLLKTLALWPKFVYLAEHLADAGITHVHAHFATHPATAAFVVSRLTGASYSITVHAHDIFVDRTLLGPKARHAAFVRCISEFNQSFLLDRVPDLDPARTVVIHVGVPPAIPDVVGRPANARDPVILCVAALKPYKGVRHLLEACRILEDRQVSFRCHIVGDGPLRTGLEEQARRLGVADRVVFEGALPQHAVAQRMREAALVVHPSVVAPTGQMDGIPVALMEAMAEGRPVVASNLSGIPELIDDGRTGLLVPPGDATRLANAIAGVLADAPFAAQLSTAGRDAVRYRFDLRENVRR